MAKSKKYSELKEYRTMWISLPYNTNKGVCPYTIASAEGNSTGFFEKELEIIKKDSKVRVYTLAGFLSYFCNLLNYSIISIVPHESKYGGWFYYITLIKD